MSIPNLNRRLELEAPQDVPDGAGGFDRIWMPMGELWAEITSGTGRETASGTAPVSVTGVKIIVRGAPVTSAARPRPEQRFREGSRVFRITAVTEADQHGRYLSCQAVEEVVT
ncbi:head-tail adaptor protein [Primorskyibacter sp. S187A]|uniref:head-tail adaptor protein n=1 Tax=Primorskyibacter sp. S187A TaxID=3415130 RepID=UPI003C7AD6DE